MNTTEPPKRRTIKVRLTPRLLRRWLNLPANCDVVAVNAVNDPVAIDVIIAGDRIPEVDYEAESPYASIDGEIATLDDGREFTRSEVRGLVELAAVTHHGPPTGVGLTGCCGKTPFELPRSDRLTVNGEDVTCRGGVP